MGLFKKIEQLFRKKSELLSKETKLLNKVFEIIYTKEADVEFEDIHKLIGNSEEFKELTQLHLITQLALKADSEISKQSFAEEMIKAYDGLQKVLNGQYKLETVLKWTEEYTSKCMTDFKLRMIQYRAAYKSNQYSYKGTKYAMMKASKRPLDEEQDSFCLKTASEIEVAGNRLKEISNIITGSQNDNFKNTYSEGLIAYKKGKLLYNDKKEVEALPYFDKAIQYGIKDAHNERAWCLESLHYDYEAIEDFTKAIELTPEDCNLYFGRGLAKHGSMDYDGAVIDAELAVVYSKIQNSDFEWRTQEAFKKGYSSLSDLYYSYLDAWRNDAKSHKERMEKIKLAKENGSEEALQSIKGVLALIEIYGSRSKKR